MPITTDLQNIILNFINISLTLESTVLLSLYEVVGITIFILSICKDVSDMGPTCFVRGFSDKMSLLLNFFLAGPISDVYFAPAWALRILGPIHFFHESIKFSNGPSKFWKMHKKWLGHGPQKHLGIWDALSYLSQNLNMSIWPFTHVLNQCHAEYIKMPCPLI